MTSRDKALENKLNSCIEEIELFRVSNEEMKYLEYLFRIKVDPTYEPIHALHKSFRMNHVDVAKKLINRFPELQDSLNFYQVCCYVIEYNYSSDIIQFILGFNLDFNREDVRSLASKNNRTDILELI